MIIILKKRRRYTQEKQWGCLEMGNGNQQLLLKRWMNLEAIMSKQKMEACTGEIENIYWRQKSDEDQTTELSDDEDEAKIVHVKSENVTNDEEKIIKPKETISEIRTRSGRISKRPNRLKDYETV